MPQNQKTAPRPALPDDLPELNPQEMKFVERLGAGDDNCVAYEAAYGKHNCSAATLRVRACQKAASDRIQAHLRALRAVGFANARLTLENRIEDELAFAQRAEDAGNFGASGQARDRINKLLGLYVERSVAVVSTDPTTTLRELAELIGEDADNIEVRH